MQKLPRPAQLYLVLVCLMGLACIFYASRNTTSYSVTHFWESALFVVLAVMAGGKKVSLMRHKGDDDVGSMSLGFAITFASMLYCGPSVAVTVSVISALTGGLYPKRQPLHQLFFNGCLSAVEAWSAGMVFIWINGGDLRLEPLLAFQAITASCLTYFAVNTGAVAIIIALCTQQNPITLWRQTFLWTAPSFFAGAGISAITIVLAGRNLSAILLFCSPVLYLTYHSYATYTGRAEEKLKHIEELQQSQARLADLYLATIKSLALAIDAKDQYTHQHILRVQRYAVAIAKHMGISGNDLEGVNTGALLHDIGKLGVPEYVLLKPGRLTADEFEKIKKHPEIGAAILDPVEFPWPVLPVVKYHHEKWDGTGYPEGLKGENIPLTARILAAADVYDALTSTRSYRQAWTHERAVETIIKDAGTHFDPVVVEAFKAVINGVVQEMAAEGYGPLVPIANNAPAVTKKADQAAKDIQRASSELWALYEVAQTLSSSLGLQETLDILARKLEAILPGTACLFLLREPDDAMLVTRANIGLNQEFFHRSRTLNARSISLHAAEAKETFLGEYDADDLMLTGSQSALWTEIRTALIVPIVYQNQALGTLNLYHPQEDAFGAHDRQLLEAIAERAALAISNGMLFDRTRSDAYTDPLTGLYNLRYLTEYVQDHCTKFTFFEPDGTHVVRREDYFTMLCLDLDSFKPINDNFGHQKGDEVLCDLGRIFQETVREKDVVARYGGDEFVIVLQGAEEEEALSMMERLQSAVENYDSGLVHPKLGTLHLGVSIGYGCFPAHGSDCATLLSVADRQMYHDKSERKLRRLASPAEREQPTRHAA